MFLRSWLHVQRLEAAERARRAPFWYAVTIVLFVYGINGIIGDAASVFGRTGWDLHGMPLLVAALGAAAGGTITARRAGTGAATTEPTLVPTDFLLTGDRHARPKV